jgi:hypothetical protein
MPLSDILRGTPVNSVADAIVVMRAIDHDLPDADGVKWFNRLYLRVTEGVEGALGGSDFEDPAFIATLDVAFANLYFAALQSGDAESAPSAWRPLLRTRYSSGIARIQFALAGMRTSIEISRRASSARSWSSGAVR